MAVTTTQTIEEVAEVFEFPDFVYEISYNVISDRYIPAPFYSPIFVGSPITAHQGITSSMPDGTETTTPSPSSTSGIKAFMSTTEDPPSLVTSTGVLSNGSVPHGTVPDIFVPVGIAPDRYVPESAQSIVPDRYVQDPISPDLYAPEIIVPESTIPESTIPESTIPESIATESIVPQNIFPENSVPDSILPGRFVPDPNVIDQFLLSNGLISTPSTLSKNFTRNEIDSRICGFVGYCQNSAYDACINTTINSCEQCSKVGEAFFLLLIIVMGLAVLIGNSVIFAVGVHRLRKGKANKMDICRSSLAVADFFTAIQIFVVVMYNYSWSTSLTALELDREQLALRGSVQAFFGATLYLFGYTSSLYHLLYIGLQRLYAIIKPIKYKWQSKRTTYIGLGIVWSLSVISATVPAWIPQYLTSSYIVPAFLYLPTLQNIGANPDYTPAIAWMVVFFALPYFLMTVATLTCGILIRVNYVKRTKKLSERCKESEGKTTNKQKVNVFITVAIMQFGFTVTLLPTAIVAFLFYAGTLKCYNFSTPYLICFYLGMSNSLVNTIVYSLRDNMFRSNAKDLFSITFSSLSSFNDWKSNNTTRSKQRRSETPSAPYNNKLASNGLSSTVSNRLDSASDAI